MTLPYLTAELPGTGGALRTTEDDFVVDEELPYAPAGTGDHVFVRVEKRGLATPAAVDVIARTLGIQPRDIGVAGLKDRHAVTRQWLSLPPPIDPAQASALALPQIRVLEAHRHPHKLRTGHVRANRFVLRVRGVAADAEARAAAILGALAQPPGAPNFYGEQRFGRDGDNAARGRAIVLGEQPAPRDRRLARLLVSSLQSALFNAWLVDRLADGLYRTAVAGDLLRKRSGGMFACTEPDVDSARLAAGELVVTGPMFGDRMRAPAPDTPAAAREAAVLARHDLPADAFARVRAIAEGTRRDASIEVGAPTVHAVDASTLELAFALPGGAYATTVMREILKDAAAAVDAAPQAR